MSLDPKFVADCLYGPEAILLDEILEIDAPNSRVKARMPTHDMLPLTREQRVDSVRHPRHVSGGLMVHMTGVIGFVHFYYVLNNRTADGWTGYGVRIHSARFHSIAKPGEPLVLEATGTRVRSLGNKIFVRYAIKFNQGDKLVYEGDQSALWMKIDENSPADVLGAF